MKVLLVLLTLAVVLRPPVVSAQAADISIGDHPTPDQIQSWLLSNDPHLMAWGAHFAREQDDPAALRLILQLIQRTFPDPKDSSPEQYTQFAFLDALIQRNVSVPLPAIAVIARAAPIQAAILASRHPIADATPLLLAWYADRSSRNAQWLARIAGMLLSHAPPPGFAASVLADEEVRLEISVVSDREGDGIGYGSGSCGDSLGTRADPTWPPIYTYFATDEGHDSSAPVLAEAAGESVWYGRREVHSGWGSCSSPFDSDDETDHHILAQMLEVSDKDLDLKTSAFARIEWTNADTFLNQAEHAVQNEEAKFLPFAEEFYAKQLITSADLLNVRPKLKVVVQDNRTAKDQPLPQLHFSDPRTVQVPPPLTLEQMLQIANPPRN